MKALATTRNLRILWKTSVHNGCDAALAARDAEAKKSEAVVAVVDNLDLSGLSEVASRIDNAISWNDTDPLTVEY